MLKVFYGPMQGAIYNTAVYFKNTYLDVWFEDEFARKMIKDVDKAEVIGPHLIESKVLGPIPPVGLSGGVKTLLLAYFDTEHVFNASTCGDNCARWFLRMAKERDVTINLRHIMDFGDRPFEIEILNNGRTVHSMSELLDYAPFFLGSHQDVGDAR